MKRICLYISFIIGALILTTDTYGLAGVKDETSMADKLKELRYKEWKFKKNEIDQIVKFKKSSGKLNEEELSLLIQIFDEESKYKANYLKNKKSEGLSLNKSLDKFEHEVNNQGYKEYYIDFAKFVAECKDKRSINALLRSIANYGGPINPSDIIGIGEEAIKSLLDEVNSNEREVKNMAYFVLSTWVNAPIKTSDYYISEDDTIKNEADLARIKNTLLSALDDDDMDVRSMAVYGLRAFPEQQVIKKLEKVAEKDPYSFYSKHRGKYVYPLRDDAKKVLNEIKEKMD